MRALAAAALLALPAAPAPAQAEGHAALPETEPAIGRLNRAGYNQRRHCTASLIGPGVALTALHCVEGTPPGELHLLLGYDRGDVAEHRRVASVVASDRADIALLCLDEEAAVAPLASAEAPEARGLVAVTGYPRTRAHAQDLRVCAAGPGPDETSALLDCPLEQGFSGSPIRDPAPDGPVVGVASASNASLSVAVLLSALPEETCPPL